MENLNERLAAAEHDVEENGRQTSMTADYLESIRYGLVESGRFMRHSSLDGELRHSVMIQERANLVLFNLRRRNAEETDPRDEDENEDPPAAVPGEDGEEESLDHDDDAMDETGDGGDAEVPTTSAWPTPRPREISTRTGRLQGVMDDLRAQLESALEREDFNDAGSIQRTLMEGIDLCDRNRVHNDTKFLQCIQFHPEFSPEV